MLNNWSQEYQDYYDQVLAFARTQLNEGHIQSDRTETFPRTLWTKCADFGIQGLTIPAKLGGTFDEVKLLRSVYAMEALGYGCRDNALVFALNAQLWTVQVPIVEFGSEDQHQKYLPALANGELIGAHALTEPEAGSDIYSMSTKAEKVDGGYILNGHKHLITLAPVADLAIVLAVTNAKVGKWGLSAFLVETSQDGVSVLPQQSKMGMRAIPIGGFKFQDCFVSEDQLLGKEGSGYSILNHSLEYDRSCILSSQVGAMKRQLESAIQFANERKQFDQPIGKFQSVSNRIVDMKLRLETSRLLLYQTISLMAEGKNASLESAMLKLHLSESFIESSLDNIRTHGGMAYLTENEIERDLRDAIGGVLYAGTSDIQRNIIAQFLGL